MENFRISTFNCTGLKSSLEYVANNLCNDHDIIALQETWLLPHDLPLCDTIHPDFCAFATSAVDVGAGVIRGRPYGGLAFLYRRSVEPLITPINFEEDRVLGLLIKDETKSLLFLNVYMPTQSNENYDQYVSTLGRVMALIHEQGVDAVCVLGDFNAKPHSLFYDELVRHCSDNTLLVCDVNHLPSDSFTHFSEAHNSTSWLDHVVASENISNALFEFKIIYGNSTSNHFPLCFKLKADFNCIANHKFSSNDDPVNWNFSNANLVNMFYNNLDTELMELTQCNCIHNNCRMESCRLSLESFYAKLCDCIVNVGRVVFGNKRSSSRPIVPGWNEWVHEHHQRAREAFLAWRAAGSPREGDMAVRMRAYRAQFKLALRECRASEERLRTEAMANQLAQNNITGYWDAVKKLGPKINKISNKLDSASGENEILKLWHDKYKSLFNSVDPHNIHNDILNMDDNCDFITVQQVSLLLNKLASNKAVGIDKVPAEVLINTSHRWRTIITIFIN